MSYNNYTATLRYTSPNYLCLLLRSGLFPLRFPTRNLYALRFYPFTCYMSYLYTFPNWAIL